MRWLFIWQGRENCLGVNNVLVFSEILPIFFLTHTFTRKYLIEKKKWSQASFSIYTTHILPISNMTKQLFVYVDTIFLCDVSLFSSQTHTLVYTHMLCSNRQWVDLRYVSSTYLDIFLKKKKDFQWNTQKDNCYYKELSVPLMLDLCQTHLK